MRIKTLVSVMMLCLAAGCSGESTAVDQQDLVSQSEKEPTGTTVDVTTTTVSMPTGTPVIIDTDMAVDGVMSILYLLGQEQLQIQAITVSGTGLVHCEAGVDQVLGILQMFETETIPVACGSEIPVEGANAFPGSWRAGADEANGYEFPPGGEPSDLDAPELIVSVIKNSPMPVVVYAVGPQTNLANALRLDPTIASNVEMVYVMGGAFDAPGNAQRNTDAEWNIWVDPVAADEVFRSDMPITLVPLDATNQTPFHIFHLAALKEHQESLTARTAAAMLSGNEALLNGTLYFWDQLPAGLLVDETYATFKSVNVEIAVGEDRSIAGTTLISDTGTQIRVVDSVDAPRFETEFLSAIAGINIGPIIVHTDLTGSFDGSDWAMDFPETLTPGEYTIRITNESAKEIGLAFGWLLNEATPEDIDDYEGTTQPSFYELESFRFAAPYSEIISVVELASPEVYVIVGLDPTADTSTAIGIIDAMNN